MTSSSSSASGSSPAAAARESLARLSQSSTEVDSVTGILLVGGASTRFGSSKAHARLPAGETLADRAWSLLAWCDERIAIGKGGERLPFPVVADGVEVRAPIAGVVAGLRLARHDLCVVVPVDVPALAEVDLQALAAACADVAIPATGPLPGAYRASTALPVLEEGLATGRLSLREAVARLRTRVVSLPDARLLNVNTRGELERFTAQSR